MPRRSVRTRRRAMGGFLSFLIGALTLAAVALVITIVLTDRFKTRGLEQPAPTAATGDYVDANDLPEHEMVLKADTFSDDYLPGAQTPAPTPAATLQAQATLAPQNGALSGEDYLPIYSKGDGNDKVIAITLDECGDLTLMPKFIQMANSFGAKLTLFPTGNALMKPGMNKIIKECYDSGFEIENRGYSDISQPHRYIATMMVQEIWKQSVALNYVLGMKYEQHFFRMYGGRGEKDRRTHAYLKQQGYLGIAHWTKSCTGLTEDEVVKAITPGGIYAFRCSQEDGELMYKMMAAAHNMGYRMVTMNAVLGLPENTAETVQGSLLAETMPVFNYNDADFRPITLGEVSWAVMMIQMRLIDLGYLGEDDADGALGNRTTVALQAFQAEAHLAASGLADVITQQRLFAADAPQSSRTLQELFPDDTNGNPFANYGNEDDEAPDDETEDAGDAPEEPEETLSPSEDARRVEDLLIPSSEF